MRKILAIGIVAILLSSCAAQVATPALGLLYTDVKAPLIATSNSGSTKVGSAECISVLGIVATGDASIEAASKDGNIKRIHHVDYQSTNVLGIFAKFKVYVYGE